jgi:hypothetical protein
MTNNDDDFMILLQNGTETVEVITIDKNMMWLLRISSEYFGALFDSEGQWNETSARILTFDNPNNDITRADFIAFLEVLKPPCDLKILDESNITAVATLSDYFGVPWLEDKLTKLIEEKSMEVALDACRMCGDVDVEREILTFCTSCNLKTTDHKHHCRRCNSNRFILELGNICGRCKPRVVGNDSRCLSCCRKLDRSSVTSYYFCEVCQKTPSRLGSHCDDCSTARTIKTYLFCHDCRRAAAWFKLAETKVI